MAYCEMEDITLRIPASFVSSLANDAGGDEPDMATVERAIADADSLINAHVRSRYQVPFTTVPELIKRLSVDLSVYYLYQRKYDNDMPEPVRFRYTDAIRLLTSIGNGAMHIEDLPDGAAPVPIVAKTNKRAEDKLFGRSTLDRW